MTHSRYPTLASSRFNVRTLVKTGHCFRTWGSTPTRRNGSTTFPGDGHPFRTLAFPPCHRVRVSTPSLSRMAARHASPGQRVAQTMHPTTLYPPHPPHTSHPSPPRCPTSPGNQGPVSEPSWLLQESPASRRPPFEVVSSLE